MCFALNTSALVNNTEPFSFPFLGLDEAVIQVGSQDMDVTYAEVKSMVVVVHLYAVIESDI